MIASPGFGSRHVVRAPESAGAPRQTDPSPLSVNVPPDICAVT